MALKKSGKMAPKKSGKMAPKCAENGAKKERQNGAKKPGSLRPTQVPHSMKLNTPMSTGVGVSPF
jgi:hypothetical protein